MRLNRISLHNFRKFRDAELTFPDGIIGFVGANGSGKSTIIEAIGWAIYGNRVARTSRDEVARMGMPPIDECWVRLEFELGGTTYEVFRMLTKKSTDAQVKVNGMIAASSTQAVTTFLEQKLRMDYDAFYTSIVARQQELNALSEKSPAERKKSMLRMLDIDLLDDAIRRVREDRRHKEAVVDNLEKTLVDIDDLAEKIRETKQNLARHQAAHKTATADLATLKKKLEEAKGHRDAEKKRADAVKHLTKEVELIEERIRHKTETLDRLRRERDDLIKKQVQYDALRPQLRDYRRVRTKMAEMEAAKESHLRRQHLLGQIRDIEEELARVQDAISALRERTPEQRRVQKEMREATERLKETERALQQVETSLLSVETEKRHLEQQNKELERERAAVLDLGPESNCPTCGRPLENHYETLVANFEKDIGAIEQKIGEHERKETDCRKVRQELSQKKEALEKRIAHLDRTTTDHLRMQERLAALNERLDEQTERRDRLLEQVRGIGEISFSDETYAKLVETARRLETLDHQALVFKTALEKMPELDADISRTEQELGTLEKERAARMADVEKLAFDANRFEELERSLADVTAAFHAKREELIRLEGAIENERAACTRVQEEYDRQQELRAHLSALRAEIVNLERLAGDRETGLLNDFKNYLIARIGPALSYHASHLFATFTNGKYSEIEIGDNYDIFVYDRGEKFELARFSGGEKDLANLSLRLAISQLIARKADVTLEFIALDEIFGSQDRERRKNVLNALAELKHQFRQIVLITHIDEIKDAMEHIVTVSEDEDGVSHARLE
jgi:exonuclease SbcC